MTAKLTGRAAKINIVVEQGATFDPVLQYMDSNDDPVDMTGWSAEMVISAGCGEVALFTASTANGMISLDASGNIEFDIPASETGDFSFTDAVYYMELTTGDSKIIRLIEGNVSVRCR